MECIRSLMGLGFNFTVNKEGKIFSKYYGPGDPPRQSMIFFKQFKDMCDRSRPAVIEYLNSSIIYEIRNDENFDFAVQECINEAYGNDIDWYRLDVQRRQNKITLTGIIKNNEHLKKWKDCCNELASSEIIDNPFSQTA